MSKETKTMMLPQKIKMFVFDENTGAHVVKEYPAGMVEMPIEHADHPHVINSGATEYDPKVAAEKAAAAAKTAKREADIKAAQAEVAEAEKTGNADALKAAQAKLEKLTK